MEYSGLVQAIQENDSSRVDELVKSLYPRLISFLHIHMNASESDAEDCAQNALLLCLQAIEKGRLHKPELVFSYLLTSCKNSYLNLYTSTREPVYEEIPRDQYFNPDQLADLLDKEKNQILQWCFKQLKRNHREFMEYWFRYPGIKAQAIADHFEISLSNTWTRKHRIIKHLNECYKKKSKL